MRARGGRDSCHAVTNASLCERTHRRRGVGWGGVGGPSLTTQLPQACHSGCYRAPSSGLDNGPSVSVGISQAISTVTPGYRSPLGSDGRTKLFKFN